MTITKVGVVGFLLELTMGIVTSAFPQSPETKTMNEALTFNADGSQRYSDIHWPEGFYPERLHNTRQRPPRQRLRSHGQSGLYVRWYEPSAALSRNRLPGSWKLRWR
jgi:hypothetical protein